jgi:predicted ATPase/transcriptional regulator with XRE-family HTH domain
MDPSSTFGAWMKRRRRSLALTQDELAQRVAYSIVTIRKVESDDLRPSRVLAEKLAKALEIPPEEQVAFVRFARNEPASAELALQMPNAELLLGTNAHSPKHNLPSSQTPLIGREKAVAMACELLRRPSVRLLTLSGPGGTGKTRLALGVATALLSDFPDGVRFFPLSALTDDALLPPTIAQELGLVDTGNQPLMENIKTYLAEKRMLLVLDSFELLTEAASLLSTLLAAAPRLKLLVTSRALLHLTAEHNFPVLPLGLPATDDLDVEQLACYPAIRLFETRAAALKPDFALTVSNAACVAQICRRLDGLPLAIELAAARLRVLSPQTLLARLDRRLPMLTDGPRDLPERQRTLRSTIEWSYQTLEETEKCLFVRLAVFAGSFSLPAAEALANQRDDPRIDVLQGLCSLVDKSLLQQREDFLGEARFAMLDTIREYGLELLAGSGEERTIHEAHAEYCLTMAIEAEAGLKGPELVKGTRRLSNEQDNMRAALAWALQSGAAEIALRLASSLWLFWTRQGNLTEGTDWLKAGLALPGALPQTRARALLAAGLLQFERETHSIPAVSWLQESLEMARRAGDQVTASMALVALAKMWALDKIFPERFEMMRDGVALARATKDHWTIGWTLFWLAWQHLKAGHTPANIAAAREALRESVALFAACGDRLQEADAESTLAYFDGLQSADAADYQRQLGQFEAAIALCREMNHKAGLCRALSSLAEFARYHDDYERARSAYDEGRVVHYERGLKSGVWSANLAAVVLHDGDVHRANQLLVEGWNNSLESGNKSDLAFMLVVWSGVSVSCQQPELAARLLACSTAAFEQLGTGLEAPDQKLYERVLADTRSQLSATAFDAAWLEGRAMQLEQAHAQVQEQLAPLGPGVRRPSDRYASSGTELIRETHRARDLDA